MSIYRGSGGSGDANTNATINEVAELVQDAKEYKDEAATSASNAATSATNAATSESNASTSETNASSSASAAATSETNAATSETNAATSAASASTSESNASTSETNAAASATSASSSASSASSSATSAAGSATTATTKASEASTSASNASTSETNAASSASSASTSATNAATSESNAATSAASAEAAYDNFDDRYLGAKASDPALDNDGDALITGALYFNTTDDVMKIYEGSSWLTIDAVQLASQAEAEGHIENTKFMSALRTFQAFSQYGLGNNDLTNEADFNTVLTTRFFEATSGSTNGPAGWGGGVGMTLIRDSGAFGVQFAMEVGGAGGYYMRVRAASSWLGWVQIWNASNMVIGTDVQAHSALLDDAVTQNSIGRKNYIINGNFDIWQRGTSGLTAETLGDYTADRWRAFFTDTDDTISVSRATLALVTGAGVGAKYALRYSVTAGSTGTVNRFGQAIEGVRTLAGQAATLSFRAKASASTTLPRLTILQNFGTGGSPSTIVETSIGNNVALTTSWQVFSYTVNIPNLSGKTLGTNEDDFLGVYFGMPINETVDIDIAQVQLEKGSVATDFEYRPIAEELALCQRYYYQHTVAQQGSRLIMPGSVYGSTTCMTSFPLPVPMRTVPTFTIDNYFQTGIGTAPTGTGAINHEVGSTHVGVVLNGTGWAVPDVGRVGYDVIADAEL